MVHKNIEGSKTSKLNIRKSIQSLFIPPIFTIEFPFKEFKDNELSHEFWGIGPGTPKKTPVTTQKGAKVVELDTVWLDSEVQPLPRSARYHLDSWVRAGELAAEKWNADIDIFEDLPVSPRMSLLQTQLSYSYVLTKSAFCRRMLSVCYILERVESLTVEHTWEGFSCNMPPEGWRGKNLIYSPGMKAGGGTQHKPSISPSGCYLVRLYYVGAWRCVWVSDLVPVDASRNPLLPFYPIVNPTTSTANKTPLLVPFHVVHMWPLLLSKALLKLAGPDMNRDDTDELHTMDPDEVEDEDMLNFDLYNALTGILGVWFREKDYDKVWALISTEVAMFTWDEDDDVGASTAKSKSVKKTIGKDTSKFAKKSLVTINIETTAELPPYLLPGISPAYNQELIINMIRDIPLKKPLPEPEVPLWKTYRWVEWARNKGLYDAYYFPRTKFLKVQGLMKLSFATHLIDVYSTLSLTKSLVHHEKTHKNDPKQKEKATTVEEVTKEKEHDWVKYDTILNFLALLHVRYYPSMYSYTTGTNQHFTRITTKTPLDKALDVIAPLHAPFYLQVDSAEKNNLRISLSTLHPRIMRNCNLGVSDYVEPVYMILELFEWFKDDDGVKKPYAFVETRCYNSVTTILPKGRHYCRLWIHSYLMFQVAILSESTLLLGSRDAIMVGATKECSWAVNFFNTVVSAFHTWIRSHRTRSAIHNIDKEFFSSYEPDLEWDPEVVGYKKQLRHWMFRKALETTIQKRVPDYLYNSVCNHLRYALMDPDFGLPPKPIPEKIDENSIQLDYEQCLLQLNHIEGYEEFLKEWPSRKFEIMNDMKEESSQKPVYHGEEHFSFEEIFLRMIRAQKHMIYKQHQAATLIQSIWRGVWARKCLKKNTVAHADIIKSLSDAIFGNSDGMSALMNEFFLLFPGAKSAYSVASALGNVYGLQQYNGSVSITPKCTWIPLFQGTFYCHNPVKVHLDVTSSLPFAKFSIVDNDTEELVPQVYNYPLTFDIKPNVYGYTILGNASLKKPIPYLKEVTWQLTVFESMKNYFHPCDDLEPCTVQSVPNVKKFLFEETYLPNKRNILGGMIISVNKNEVISFKATTTYSELVIEAVLNRIDHSGVEEEVAGIRGKGEIYWPYIKLDGPSIVDSWIDEETTSFTSYRGKRGKLSSSKLRPLKTRTVKDKDNKERETPESRKESVEERTDGTGKGDKDKAKDGKKGTDKKSVNEFVSSQKKGVKSKLSSPLIREYVINITAPKGWPLSVDQWKKVVEIRNENEPPPPPAPLTPTKGKKAKHVIHETPPIPETNAPEDAFVTLECTLPVGGSVMARRDDTREQAFIAAKLSWGAKDPNRNATGEAIRQAFRDEFLAPPTPLNSEFDFEAIHMFELSEEISASVTPRHVVSITSKTDETSEEKYSPEKKFMKLPEQFQDKFKPLPFLEECTKEMNDYPPVIITPDIAEASVKEREVRIENANQRRLSLQAYNDLRFLKAQKKRNNLLMKLNTDHEFSPLILLAIEERDKCIAKEIYDRHMAQTRKKSDVKSIAGSSRKDK